jgi:hypothetical protein
MVHLLLAAAVAAAPLQADTAPPRVYDGSLGQLDVDPPLVEDPGIRIDGRADEEAWGRAAVLTGFTRFRPVEGLPASERTEVRILYTPRDLFIAVRAYTADPSGLRATIAARDRITADDHVRLYLDTFHDRRRAFVFFVNPLGIQQDGVLGDGDGISFSPDFLFDSRGRLTGDGYEVELRIPLASLKFPADQEQRWGLQVVRVIPATGVEESWAPRRRNEAAELTRAGTLGPLVGLRPGRLLEIHPSLTARRDGLHDGAGFQRGPLRPDAGVNLKYGLSTELTLDATVNPDFSQVEADADRVTVNERFALSLEEKRPFFLEGADLLSTQETLVYTRAIVSPLAGVRVTGALAGSGVAYLAAVDDHPRASPARLAPAGERALFQVLRARRDLGPGSTLGVLATSRAAGGAHNRVASVDARFRSGVTVFGGQVAASWTRTWTIDPAATDSAGPPGSRVPVALHDLRGHLARVFVDRTGRRWGYLVTVRDLPEGFRTESGFVRRVGISEVFGGTRVSWFGREGALLQRVDLRGGGNRIFAGRDLWRAGEPAEGSSSLRMIAELRGNHELRAGWQRGFFTLDPAAYERYVVAPGGEGPQAGEERAGGRIGGLDGWSLEVSSARFRTFQWGAGVAVAGTPLFAEGTRGREVSLAAEVALRPTEAVRVDAALRRVLLHRAPDGSRYSDAVVPRLRVEYQFSRALAARALVQYPVERVDVLRAPDGRPYLLDGEPFRVRRGEAAGADEPQWNPLRTDLLLSYRPSPGTVVFLGYGREMSDTGAFRPGSLVPRSDGVFLKTSYLFRR